MSKSNKNYPSLLNTLGFSTRVNKKNLKDEISHKKENKKANTKTESETSDSSDSGNQNSQSQNSQTECLNSNNPSVIMSVVNKKNTNDTNESDEHLEESSISPTLIEELKSVKDLDSVSTKSMVTSKTKKKEFINEGSYDTEDLLKSEFIDKSTKVTYLNDKSPYEIINKIINLLNKKDSHDSIDKKILKYSILLKDHFDIDSDIANLTLAEDDIMITKTQLSPISETNISISPSFGGSYMSKKSKQLSKERVIIPKHKI